jgi:hypothetical protein
MTKAWSRGGLFGAVVVGVLALSGCTVNTGNASPSGTATPGSNTTETPTDGEGTSGLTCYEIAECAAKCRNGDEACAEACIAKGSGEGKAAADALNACGTKHACADSECVATSCQAEIDACKAQGSSKPAAGGSIPANLVGTWTSTGGGAYIVRTFNADGTYGETSVLTVSGSCESKQTYDIEGTAAFAATTMTLNRVSGTLTSETCSGKSTKDVTASTETKSWKLEDGVLYTWAADCQDYKTCAVSFMK